MAKQITLRTLQDSLDRAKSYVDSRANANVIKTSSSLYKATNTSTPNTITLSQSLDDFDAVTVILAGTTNPVIEYTLDVADLEYGTTQVGFQLDSSYYVWYNFTNSTTMTKAYGEHKGYLKEIKGVKYSHPVEYTTTEKVIGTYLGKTLYEKTLTNINVAEPAEGQATNVLLTSYGIEGSWTVVDYEGVAQITTGSSIAVLPYAYARSDGTYDATLYVQRTSSGQWTINNTRYGWNVKALTLRYIKESL